MSANVSILGNLGRAPETRTNSEGLFIASFSIASNTVKNTPSGHVKKTDWFNVTAIGNQAKTLAKYAKKGAKLYVQGKLTFNPWLDRQGVPQVSADLLLQDFQFVRSNNEESEVEETGQNAIEHEISTDVQEIPNQTGAY
jgi:single-strand DNA-binding protein